MLKKIALILAPPFWPNLPPLSLITLGGFLAKSGYNPELIDLNNIYFNQATEIAKKSWLRSCNKLFEKKMLNILKHDISKNKNGVFDKLLQSEIIGFSCYKSNIKTSLLLAKQIKKTSRHTKIIFGGPELAWIYFKNSKRMLLELKNVADLLIVGEGEKPLLDFLQGKTDNKIVCFDEVSNLNGYDFVSAYKKLRSQNYPKKKSVSLFLSRGCIRKCRFCSEKLLYEKFRKRQTKDIIKEIEFHKNRGIKSFVFHDSMLNADLSFLENLCDEIINNFGQVPWEAQMAVRVDMLDNLLKKIKQSGCYNIFIGLESASDMVLKRMDKGFTQAEALDFLKKLKSSKLYFGLSLIIGFPGETDEDLEESLGFLVKNKEYIPKIEQVNPFVHYPGTDADKSFDYRSNKNTIEKTNWFIEQLKRNKFKMTNAFLNNLIEK